MFKRLGLSLLVLLLGVPTAQAQLVVIDPADIAQNTITAIESTLTTIEEVIHTAQGVLNLTPLDDIATTGGLLEDMALLGRLVEESQQILRDLDSLDAQIHLLFALDSAPTTSTALAERLQHIRRLKQLAYTDAARVQTLMKTALTTVNHMRLLLETLAQLIGNLQGQQLVAQHAAAMHRHLANMQTQQAAYFQAQSLDKLEEGVTVESWRRIKINIMTGY